MALFSFGIKIDKLTKEQIEYHRQAFANF
jgi:hypothetical protein